MTHERRLALLTTKADIHTKANTENKASAVRALVKEGLYTKKGMLSSNYGGARIAPRPKKA